MSRMLAPAVIPALLVAAFAGPSAAEPAPPGCRWQSSSGGQVLACKDAQGYWRRSGDNEIVGYDPPRARPAAKPAPPADPPPPQTPPPDSPALMAGPPPPPMDLPDVVRAPDGAAPLAGPDAQPAQAGPAPPEPPIEPRPPMSPLERFFHWLLQLWRGFTAWLASLV